MTKKTDVLLEVFSNLYCWDIIYQLPEVDLVKDSTVSTTRPDKISENEEIL